MHNHHLHLHGRFVWSVLVNPKPATWCRRSDQRIAQGGAGVLDGQTFTGEYGLVGKSAHGTDTWIFRNGSLLSKGCEECGFPESGYAAYSEVGGVSFKTTTNCPVTDAQIVWEGTVNNGKIEGVWTWTKKRWYRTIRKQFWCRGSIQDTVVDVSDSGS